MNDLQADIFTKLESIISETVKKEVTTALRPFEENVAAESRTISDLEHSANEHDDQLTSLKANVTVLSATAESLSKKCEDLEARSRWNNYRLVGLPEGSEGPRPTEFMAQLLQDFLGLTSYAD